MLSWKIDKNGFRDCFQPSVNCVQYVCLCVHVCVQTYFCWSFSPEEPLRELYLNFANMTMSRNSPCTKIWLAILFMQLRMWGFLLRLLIKALTSCCGCRFAWQQHVATFGQNLTAQASSNNFYITTMTAIAYRSGALNIVEMQPDAKQTFPVWPILTIVTVV